MNLQYLSFEVSPTCNMADCHPFCPAAKIPREGPAAKDENIIDFSALCHKQGFAGWQCYHYYNDPLTDPDRCIKLIRACPWAKHLIWTNGALLTHDMIPWLLGCRVVVTLHDRRLEPQIRAVLKGHPDAQICNPAYDRRIDIYTAPALAKIPCYRPSLIELPVAYNGQVHLCCGDWAGTVPIGHIMDGQRTLDNFQQAAINAEKSLWTICRRCASLPVNPLVR